VPAYNSAPTGALVILDPATGTREVRTDIVPDGAVHCLAADESYVFGAGGGSVFALEPGTLRKVRERRLAATAMVSLPDGTLAVAAETNVVGLDPRTFESRWEAAFASHPKLTRLHRLAVGGSSLFGASDSGIYLVDASRSRLVQLTQLGTRHLAADQQGRLYFSAGDSLYRYDPRGDVEPAQTAPASDAIPFYEDKFDLLKWKDAEGRLRPVENAGDWARRRAHILAGMQQVMGPLPGPERQVAPDIRVLSEETLGTVIRKKITYAAEPNDRVPAYLLIPQQIQGRVPAVLCLHQTFRGGKDEPAGLDGSQDLWYALELARRGYVTLAPDYMPLGENRSDPYALGYQSTTMKGIWNHMAAVDLLASLPEVDAGRIGCAGHSLGGHNALFLAAFDTRIKVAVSSCGFDSFRDYMGGNLRGWSQRAYYMPRIAEVFGGDPGRLPFDWPEVLAAIAPRAAFVNAPLHDGNFRVASVRRCLEAAARVYDLLGAPDALQAVHPEAAHGFPVSARRAAWSVLDRVLGGGAPR